ncbi:hypothetical protein GCM10018966_039920 [Streptomyces yanii]
MLIWGNRGQRNFLIVGGLSSLALIATPALAQPAAAAGPAITEQAGRPLRIRGDSCRWVSTGRVGGAVGRVLGLLGAEAFDADGGRSPDVLDTGSGDAVVTAAAHPVAVDELVHGALAAGARSVEPLLFRILLVGTVLVLEVVEATGQEVPGPG